jgi:hypothetical protein
VKTWFDYRSVWAAHRWLLAYFVVVIAILALAIYGMVLGHGPLLLLFLPALAGLYAHHLLVMKRLD